MKNIEKQKEINEVNIMDNIRKVQQKEFPNEKIISVVKIKDNVYWIKFHTWNISYYVDSSWEWLAPVGAYTQDEDFHEKLAKLWYKTRMEWTKRIITRLKDNIDIDKEWIEYYNIFVDLDFQNWSEALFLAKKYALTPEQMDKLMLIFMRSWVFRIKDLILFYERWSIKKEDFLKYLSKLQKKLIEQCIDERWLFKKVWDEVTEDELKMYYWWNPEKIKYIDEATAKKCYEILKQKKQNNIKKNTHSNLEVEKNSFVV